MPEYHPWMFCGKGRVEDNILDFDDPLRKLINLLISFKKDASSVGKIETTRKGGQLAIDFNLPDDQVRQWYGVNARHLTFLPIARLKNL